MKYAMRSAGYRRYVYRHFRAADKINQDQEDSTSQDSLRLAMCEGL